MSRRQGEGSGLALMLAIAAMGMAVIGWAIPAPTIAPTTTTGNFSPKITGLISSNQALSHTATAYCIGLDSGPISPGRAGDYLQVAVSAAVASINVTGQVFVFRFYLGANGVVPSHTFGVGHCASVTGATLVTNFVYCAVTGTSFTATSVFAATRASGTYWAWVEGLPITTDMSATFSESIPAYISILDVSTGAIP